MTEKERQLERKDEADEIVPPPRRDRPRGRDPLGTIFLAALIGLVLWILLGFVVYRLLE